MAQASEMVKITDSPFDSPVGIAFGLIVLTTRSPRSDTSVTLLVNAGTAANLAGPITTLSCEIGRSSAWQYTDETKELFFDLSGPAAHSITVAGHRYDIQLLNIGKVEKEEQIWPCYEFYVTKLADKAM